MSGVPSTVTVYNNPTIQKMSVNYDFGVYMQDSWTIKRLTLNPGARVQWFKSGMDETSMGAGRFVPARFFVAQPDLPKWGAHWAPRFSAAYDLFVDGKTALKGSVSKYYYPRTNGWATRYSNSGQTTESRQWFDADLIPGTATRSGIVLATNNDGIAQDNEIGPSGTTNFGQRSDRNPVDGLKRNSNWEYTASVQHQLVANMSMTASWFRRTWRDMEITDRGQITLADYTSFTLPMPDFSIDPTLKGVLDPNEVITVYNLSTAKLGVYGSSQVDYNSSGAFNATGEPDQAWYTGYEVSFSARFARTTIFGGYTIERNVNRFCDNNDNPNGQTASDLYKGTTVARGGRFCDGSKLNVPFSQEFKLSGNYPLPYGVDFAAVLQAYPGDERVIT